MPRGKEAIAEYLRAVCGNGTRHRIENKVLGKNGVAFDAARQYPDESSRRDDAGGARQKIVREVSVEAWDERQATGMRLYAPRISS